MGVNTMNHNGKVEHMSQPQQQLTDEQRRQAMELIQNLANAKAQANAHKPIISALGDLGIEVRVMTVMIGEEPTDCLVIPTQELLMKEYEKMSGVSPTQFMQPKGESK